MLTFLSHYPWFLFISYFCVSKFWDDRSRFQVHTGQMVGSCRSFYHVLSSLHLMCSLLKPNVIFLFLSLPPSPFTCAWPSCQINTKCTCGWSLDFIYFTRNRKKLFLFVKPPFSSAVVVAMTTSIFHIFGLIFSVSIVLLLLFLNKAFLLIESSVLFLT